VEYRRDNGSTSLSIASSGRRSDVSWPRVNAAAVECRSLIERKCAERGWDVLEMSTQPDHVHGCVRVPPTLSAAVVVKERKGLTSPKRRLHHRHLLRLHSLWTRSYFASTARSVSAAAIRRYIAARTGL
jgi:putative transposase